MSRLPLANGRQSRRHGLAAELPQTGPGANRIDQLAQAFRGAAPADAMRQELALAAAAAQYRVEQVQTMFDELWERAACHGTVKGTDALLASLDLLGLWRTIGSKGQVEQLQFALRTHRLLTDYHAEGRVVSMRTYGLRTALLRLERYRRRALSERAKAFDCLTAAELAASSLNHRNTKL